MSDVPHRLHPIIQSAEQYEVPRHPIRDDAALSPTEDLDREPDGVPHGVVGYTAAFSVMFAILVAFLCFTGSAGRIAAVILLAVAIPLLVRQLGRKADRDRDHVHPSR